MENNLDFIFLYKKEISLISGCIISIFTLGFVNISIFMFIWPFCFLNYLHYEENKTKSLILTYICILISSLIKWAGYTGEGIISSLYLCFYFSLETMIPFLVYKLLYKKIENWRSALLFPLLVSSTEFICSYFTPYNVNKYAYSQAGNLIFSQVISLFGLYFLSFLISFFSSLLVYVIDDYNNIKKINKWIYYYIAIIIFFLLYGLIYLHLGHSNKKIKVASCSGLSNVDYMNVGLFPRPIEDYESYIEENTNTAKIINASLIVFAEETFLIDLNDYDDIVNRAKDIAKKYNIFMSFGLDVFTNDTLKNYNDNILISNKGDLIYNYRKHYLVPIKEDSYIKGTEGIKVFDTEIGRITTVICYDINIPYFMNSVGFKHPDIVIVPSWDFYPIINNQLKVAKYRAIENGYNIIKNTLDGKSVTIDYQGRIMSYFRNDGKEIYFTVSDVYTSGINTLYSYIGIVFNYLYIIGIVVLLFINKPKYIIDNSNTENETINKSGSLIKDSELIEKIN